MLPGGTKRLLEEPTVKRIAWSLLTIGFGVALSAHAEAQTSSPAPSPALKDSTQLCEKLAGTEREICLRKAQQSPGASGSGVGATPGAGSGGSKGPDAGNSKSEDDKRGNTAPGKSRAGDAPAAGAIADPAGVTKR
jgi:hypothetical protein